MKRSLKTWRTVGEPAMDAVFGPIGNFLDRRRRKNSFQKPVICGHGRDALRYYENGDFVVIEAELMCGDLDRLILRSHPLKWEVSGELLGDAKAELVMQKFCHELDRKKIRWKFGGSV